MNILIVSKNYHPHVGGVETQMRKLSHALARLHSVEVAAVYFQEFRLGKRLKKLEDNLLLPRFQSYADGDVTVHALTPTAIDRLRLLPSRRVSCLGQNSADVISVDLTVSFTIPSTCRSFVL